MIEEIKSFLDLEDYCYWENFSTEDYLGIGLPRFTVMLQGKHLYIEVKTLIGKQREAQEGFEATCKANGHYYLLARSVTDVRRKLKELGEV